MQHQTVSSKEHELDISIVTCIKPSLSVGYIRDLLPLSAQWCHRTPTGTGKSISIGVCLQKQIPAIQRNALTWEADQECLCLLFVSQALKMEIHAWIGRQMNLNVQIKTQSWSRTHQGCQNTHQGCQILRDTLRTFPVPYFSGYPVITKLVLLSPMTRMALWYFSHSDWSVNPIPFLLMYYGNFSPA